MFKRWLLADTLMFVIVLSFAAQICVGATTRQNVLGIAYGANGPLAGVFVSAAGDNGSGSAITDSSGQYTMTTGLKTGTYNLTTLAYGYIDSEVESVNVTAGQTTSGINFDLQLSGGISGTVTDAVNQTPINSADIYAELSNGTGTFGFYGITGSDGSYLIATNLPTGMYNVSILLAPDGYISKMTTASVTAGVETKNVNLALARSGIISGNVAAPNGTGLFGIDVVAFSSSGNTSYYGYATTDSAGNYRIATGLGTSNYTLEASGDGNYTMYGGIMNPVEVPVIAGQETSGINMELTPVTITATPSGTITGRITDQSGNPIRDALVNATGSGGYGSGETDSNGDYNTSSGLGNGNDYNVSATASGYYDAYYSTLVTVTVGQTTSNINIQMTAQLAQTFGTITGTVTGPPNPITPAIYINADGSITPSTAPIYSADNITYTLTGNIVAVADGIVVERDSIIIDGAGHTVQGTNDSNSAGIVLSGRNDVMVKNTQIEDFHEAILLNASSSNNSLTGNNITANYDGIDLIYSSNNSISGNNITANNWIGIFLAGSNNTSIIRNNITANSFGIDPAGSSNNSIIENNITANIDTGIELDYASSNNSIIGNNITANKVYGIATNGICNNTSISGNNITANGFGFYLSLSINGIISDNNITKNNVGIYIFDHTSNNTIYHNNFINNPSQAYIGNDSTNTWDDGYPSGGNYWSNYVDVDSYRGPGQNVSGSDGIWDHQHVIDANNTDHYPLVNLWVQQEVLAARGTDNRIYYRCQIGGAWQGWNVLPGSTVASPAVAMLGNQLYFVVLGSDGTSLWCGYLTNPENPSTFSGWTLLSGATPSSPTLSSNGTALALSVRGEDNRIYYRFYTAAAQTWTGWSALPSGATLDSPAASLVGNGLYIVVRGTDGSTLWYSNVNQTTGVFSGWTLLSGSTPSTPTLTTNGATLALVVRGEDNRIYYRFYAVATQAWTGWTALPSGTTLDSPAAIILENTLYIVVRGSDGNSLWQSSIDLGTSTFSGWTQLSGSTPSKPTLTS